MTDNTDPSDRLVRYIVEQTPDGQTSIVTWLNHFSIQHVDWSSLSQCDLIGVDGTLLQLLLRSDGISVDRTSADMTLPKLLSEAINARVALVGGVEGTATAAATNLGHDVVLERSGFGLDHQELRAAIETSGANILILGLGARLQEEFAVTQRARSVQYVATAGGWLDQLAQRGETYFPVWVQRLRLAWLLRLIREPARLWRRYSIDAIRIIWRRRKYLADLRASAFYVPEAKCLVGKNSPMWYRLKGR